MAVQKMPTPKAPQKLEAGKVIPNLLIVLLLVVIMVLLTYNMYSTLNLVITVIVIAGSGLHMRQVMNPGKPDNDDPHGYEI